jgi:hypothetical protein
MLLAGMGFDWQPADRNLCAALLFRKRYPHAPPIVGLIGGASSGKTTIFNSLVNAEVSRISAQAHETLGPVAAVPHAAFERVEEWSQDALWFPGFDLVPLPSDAPTSGRPDAVQLFPNQVEALSRTVVVDLPDVTSRMSVEEGSLARTLLPWFDGVIVVVDEERWFDATVFEDIVAQGRNFGPRVWLVFNRTERSEELTPDERAALSARADECRADGMCVSPYQAGSGYRPVATHVCDQIRSWLEGVEADGRLTALERHLQRRCAELLRVNVSRSRQFDELRRDVDRQLDELTAETRLTADLLTAEERSLLGLGHRLVPLYHVLQSVRRRFGGFGFSRRGDREVDFEKRTEQLAEVLRRNLEHRFRHAADRIDLVICDNPYVSDAELEFAAEWSIPPFDEHEWARRIRSHIDAWKAETMKQSRRSDAALLSLGVPLLLADLLFLGGAGVTLMSAGAWVAGMFGGKGLLGLIQKSSAYSDYQTTVRAYQLLIRDSLRQQAERNVAAIPRRHLSMTDPTLQAVMSLSTPKGR